MSMGNTSESDLLLLLFNATNWANIADNAATTPVTNWQLALHTADPGEAGTQATSEATYTSYARTAIARTAGGFTVSGTAPTQAANAALISCPACTGGSNTITHFSIGKTSSGATTILVKGALTSSLVVSSGITPQFAIGQLTITLD